MRILVTGGFGFIGSSFCRLASANGHDLIILDKMTYAADYENLPESLLYRSKVIICDIADTSALHDELNNVDHLDWIVNFAAESHVDRSIKNGTPFVNSNILGVVNILEYLKLNLDVKLLQVSTDEVFGTIEQGDWDVDQPLYPRSAYSSSKASAEMFCTAYKNTHGVDVVISRCANNFGPRQSAEKLIPTIIRSVLSNEPIPVYGDGKNRREWIFVDDHAGALLKIVEKSNAKLPKYNIGGDEKSNIEIVKLFLKLMGKSEDLILYVDDRLGHDFRYAVNDSRYISEYGKYKSADFQYQIQSTIDWYLENHEWLKRSLERLTR